MIEIVTSKGDTYSFDRETERTFKNGMFVPYIEYRFPKRALKSINIGPTMNESIFYTSTNRMLFNFGYEKIDVNWSKIPLRY